jgi:hypothetical protein
VGGIVAIVLFALLAWYMMRQRRRNRIDGQDNSYLLQQRYEQDRKYANESDSQALHEADAGPTAELPGGSAAEMAAHQRPVELPAGPRATK